MDKATVEQIRHRNDVFRRTFIGGRVFLTPSVAALSDPDRNEVITQVRCFEDFNEGNDPYEEHDLGTFEFKGTKYLFKVDYYASDECLFGAESGLNCYRVLTIMEASEW